MVELENPWQTHSSGFGLFNRYGEAMNPIKHYKAIIPRAPTISSEESDPPNPPQPSSPEMVGALGYNIDLCKMLMPKHDPVSPEPLQGSAPKGAFHLAKRPRMSRQRQTPAVTRLR